MVDFRLGLYMVDFIWGTLRGRLYEDSFTWTILHGPTIAGHYSKAIHLYELIVVMTLHLPVLIIVISTSKCIPLHSYSRSSASFTSSMEPSPLVPAAPSMETPQLNRPVASSRARLQGVRLLRPHCAK